MRNQKKPSPYVPHSIQLGTFFKRKRLQSGLSQSQVAIALKYETAQVVSNWERGTQSPPFERLLELCTVLNISRREIINRLLDEQSRIYEESLYGQSRSTRKRKTT